MKIKTIKKLNFKNITVSGKICTGTTTLSNLLHEKLGWKYYDAGTFFRDYCHKRGLQLENTSIRSDALRKTLDYRVRDRLKNKTGLIHEGWLAGFFAQKLKGVLKVLLVCDESLRIDRLVNRDQFTVEKAKKHINKREKQNHETWVKTYQKEWKNWVGKKEINFFDPQLYDLVIDTYSHSREQTLKAVLTALGWYV